MNGLSDADALRRSLAEPSRFAAVYERHLVAVHDYLRRRVGEGPAEDLAAEVFVRAFRGRSRYAVQYDTALPWLLGIANNVIGDHRRTETRRLAALEQVVTEPRDPPAICPIARAESLSRARGHGGRGGEARGAR